MEPDNNNQNQTPSPAPEQVPAQVIEPEQVKQVVQEYSRVKDTTSQKKLLFVIIFIGFGISLIALIFLLAYNADGSRTDEKMEQIQQETVPAGNVEEPSAE